MADQEQLRALGCTAEFANAVDALTDGNVLSRLAALEAGVGSLAIKDEGATVVTTPTVLDFRGGGVAVSDQGSGVARVTIAGGGGGGGLALVAVSGPGISVMDVNTRYLVTVASTELQLPPANAVSVNDEIEVFGLSLTVTNGGGTSRLWFGLVPNVTALYSPADTTLCALKLVAFRLNENDGYDWMVVAHEGDISDQQPQ